MITVYIKDCCREHLNIFAKEFVKKHRQFDSKTCNHTIAREPTTNYVFNHYEHCLGIRGGLGIDLLGPELSDVLTGTYRVKTPSARSFLEVFKHLLESVRSRDLVTLSDGRVLVPYTLHPSAKRFWVSFLRALCRGHC